MQQESSGSEGLPAIHERVASNIWTGLGVDAQASGFPRLEGNTPRQTGLGIQLAEQHRQGVQGILTEAGIEYTPEQVTDSFPYGAHQTEAVQSLGPDADRITQHYVSALSHRISPK